jgi:hypothetical protein
MADDERTPVILREYPDGQIIALFPAEPADIFGYDVMSYMHVGQHGAAGYNHVVSETRPADPFKNPDAMALYEELEQRGYSLRLWRRRTNVHMRAWWASRREQEKALT